MDDIEVDASGVAARRFDRAMQQAVGTGLAVALLVSASAAGLGRSLYPMWWWVAVGPLVLVVVAGVVVRCVRGALDRAGLVLLAGGVALGSAVTAMAVGAAVPDVGTAMLPVVVVTVLGLGFLAPPLRAMLLGAVVVVGSAIVPGVLRSDQFPAFATQAVIQVLILLATTAGGGAARRVVAVEERAHNDLVAAVVADRAAAALRVHRRELRRQLHDVVLNTLAALGRGHLTATDEIRARCAEDAAFLRTHREQDDVGDTVLWTRRLGEAVVAASADGFAVELVGSAARADLVPTYVAAAVSRAVAQALSNVQRHSGTRRARVEYHGDGARVLVRIIDRGFGREGSVEGLGVRRSVRERMDDIHGSAEIAPHPISGTVVTLRWPR